MNGDREIINFLCGPILSEEAKEPVQYGIAGRVKMQSALTGQPRQPFRSLRTIGIYYPKQTKPVKRYGML